MLTKGLHRAGLRGWFLHAMSLGSVLLCVLLWQRRPSTRTSAATPSGARCSSGCGRRRCGSSVTRSSATSVLRGACSAEDGAGTPGSAKLRRKAMTVLPELHLTDWRPTKDTLHLYGQVVGKIRLATTPPRNHWWNVP